MHGLFVAVDTFCLFFFFTMEFTIKLNSHIKHLLL